MASGRTSCTVGAFGTAEVYNNASGGASSVTLYATSTDRTGCFNISVNISDTAITPEISSTVLCACAGVCSCLDYSKVGALTSDSGGNFRGLTCFVPDCISLCGNRGGYFPDFSYYRCTGEVVETLDCGLSGNYVCPQVMLNAPLPWLGSIEPSGCNLDLVPAFTGCWSSTFNLACFKTHGGDVEEERAQEWFAAAKCNQASYCGFACCDRDGCCGSGVATCHSMRPCYGQAGTFGGSMCFDCYCMMPFTVDYWSQCKVAFSAGPSQASTACIAGRASMVRCQDQTVANFITANNCMDGVQQNCCMNHCFDIFCNKLDLSACHTCYFACICCCNSCDGFKACVEMSKSMNAMCNMLVITNIRNGCTYFRSRVATDPGRVLLCACSAYRCSCLNLNYSGNGMSPIKWSTYNCIDNKNYFMWFHENTADWNGIYSIDGTQFLKIRDYTCCCQCFMAAYSSGDSFADSTVFTKAGDIPSCWSAIGAKDIYFVNAHQVGPTCFVTLQGTYDDTGIFNPDRYYSADLINWYKTTATSIGATTGDCTAVSGSANCFNILTSCYYSLCDSGQIENKTEGLQLERTGIVTSNGDRIYLCNCSANPVSVNVWGYEE